MGGNVWEWTSTLRRNGVVALSCGGAWDSGNPGQLQAECRSWLDPKRQADHLGFRCAR
jgi:formylglycine-generating enzyme required for sulfatase activity